MSFFKRISGLLSKMPLGVGAMDSRHCVRTCSKRKTRSRKDRFALNPLYSTNGLLAIFGTSCSFVLTARLLARSFLRNIPCFNRDLLGEGGADNVAVVSNSFHVSVFLIKASPSTKRALSVVAFVLILISPMIFLILAIREKQIPSKDVSLLSSRPDGGTSLSI